MKVDYIVVGLGLAGLAFCEELIQANKSFIVFEDNSQNSSSVASGTYNPVILKRFTPVWNGHQQLELALPFYEKVSEKLGKEFDTRFSTKKVFNSVGDENNWFIASDKPMLAQYMNPEIFKTKIKGVIGDFGFGELLGTGRIATKDLINKYRTYLNEQQKLETDSFNYENLNIDNEKVSYHKIKASKVVFCEGFGLKKNPFFNHLPLNGTKGEIITIYAPELNIDFLLKSSVFVLPLGKDFYKVGATFNWTDKTLSPTEEGKQELVNKLEKTISVPYQIIDQTAGIRPTVKDRRPLVGVNEKYSNLAVLNGLGTRGVMIAPTVAKNLFNHLEKGEKLDPEIDIKRFTN
ncbi:NAD(P)/FAD-dependent oxidoreductase [Tenacibaculum jejuense]|uniref:FAD dependent oxidoreductase n=1 Tax=Tenacibaculum jejuense TaxID=584609 RepID=A0A238UDB8_9FLAO|nr:FAD-dependent oxidoreductase [Tenacibaculum jejuense]SNR17193.1 FAD dependent oxidoreductase [Tenacibaculum jejuense]